VALTNNLRGRFNWTAGGV